MDYLVDLVYLLVSATVCNKFLILKLHLLRKEGAS